MSLILFDETSDQKNERLFLEMKKEITNVRRGLFARHAELEKKYQDIYFELETLKASIAKQQFSIWENRGAPERKHGKIKQQQSQFLFL